MKKLFSILLSALFCANVIVTVPPQEIPDSAISPPAIEQEGEGEGEYETNEEDPGCNGDAHA